MILAIDPGGTSGLSTGVESFEAHGLLELWRCLNNAQPRTIIYESFRRRQKAADLAPVEAIGVIRLWAAAYKAELVPQGADLGKSFWTDDKLKQIGLYVPGKPHAMDALRHFLYYVTFTLEDHSYLDRLKYDEP